MQQLNQIKKVLRFLYAKHNGLLDEYSKEYKLSDEDSILESIEELLKLLDNVHLAYDYKVHPTTKEELITYILKKKEKTRDKLSPITRIWDTDCANKHTGSDYNYYVGKISAYEDVLDALVDVKD